MLKFCPGCILFAISVGKHLGIIEMKCRFRIYDTNVGRYTGVTDL